MGHRKIRFYTTGTELVNALAMAWVVSTFFLAPLISLAICFCVYYSPFYPLLFTYFIWMTVDRNTPHKDGRKSPWVSSMWMYRRFKRYFPQNLVKTADIPPDKNYMFCMFPHGILATALFAHFVPLCREFEKLFPGLTTTIHTLNSNFLYPFMREFTMFVGWLSVSKEALMHQLSKPPCGRGVVIYPGGSAEVMVSQPNTHRLAIKNRKGFIRLALVTGAHLVPIYSFGETDLLDHKLYPRESITFRTQEYIRKKMGFAPVFACIRGGGFLQDSYGCFPRPRPVFTIVGKPIQVEKNLTPSAEEVNALHEKFVNELVQLFEEHKYRYIENAEDVHLTLEEL